MSETAAAAGVEVLACSPGGDQSVLGLMAVFQEQRLKIPGDIPVVGFDDIPAADQGILR